MGADGALLMAPRRPSAFRAVAFCGDVAIAVAALDAAFLLRTRVSIPGTLSLLPAGSVRFTPGNILFVAAVQALALWFFGLYRDHERFREPLARLLLPALFIELLTLASVYFLAQPYSFPRSVLIVYILVNGALLAAWRALLDRLFPQPRRRRAAGPAPRAAAGRPRCGSAGARSSSRTETATRAGPPRIPRGSFREGDPARTGPRA